MLHPQESCGSFSKPPFIIILPAADPYNSFGEETHGQRNELPIMRSFYTRFTKNASSNPMGTGGSFLENKAAGAWSWSLTSI
jgi:hypothetical protein